MSDDSPPEKIVQLRLTEIELLLEALDAYEYWQLGDVLPRNNGEVFIPGDLPPGEDRYWDGEAVTEEEASAIEAVRACRDLADHVRALRWMPVATDADPSGG